MGNNIPRHVAIILDGNRRFAKRLMMEPWKGHEYGAEKVEKLLDWAAEIGIKEITLYVLSIDNINNRPKNELEYLFRIFKESFRKIDKEKIDKYKIRIRFIGNSSLLPEDLAEQCRKLEKETEKNTGFFLNFALAYGGREEIIEAVRKIIKNKLKYEEIEEKTIRNNLYLKDEPELIIRTGGEIRTSNFLNFQSGYSEWIFLEKFWPEFEKQDLMDAVETFKKRKRNFGA